MKRKITGTLAALFAAAALLSGCDLDLGGSVYGEMDAAVEKGDIEALKSIADGLLSGERPDKTDICAAAKRCGVLGDYDSAADYYGRCLDIYPDYEIAANGYVTALWKAGALDALRDNFPSDEEIIFRGKVLSDYDSRELIEMTSTPNQISYRTPEYVYDRTEFYSDGADKEMPMPYGITQSMSAADIYEAAGFAPEQAARLKAFYYMHIDLSDDGFSVTVKESRYAPFSQHPAEDNEFTVKNGRVALTFNCFTDLSVYTVGVLI